MQDKIRQMAHSLGLTISWIHLIESEESAKRAADIAAQTLVDHGVSYYDGLVTYGPSTIYANAWMVTINYPGGDVHEQKLAVAHAALDAAFASVKLVETYTHLIK